VETTKIEKMPVRDLDFTRKIRKETQSNFDRCYQCSACSNGCPSAYAMDYYPNQIIHMVRLGLKKKVLKSKTIWICISCETCGTRCPNEIDIVRLMDILRKEAINGGFKSPVNNIPGFHKVFVNQIKKKWRIDEGGLLVNYELKTFDFLSFKKMYGEMVLGLKLLRKGRLKLPSWEKYSVKEIKSIFKKVVSDK